MDLNLIGRRAKENKVLAVEETDKAKKIKLEAKVALKRTKARVKFIEKELELADKREDLANISKKLVKLKTQYKQEQLWEELDYELRNEQKIIDYNLKLVSIKKEISQIQKKIAQIEESIANDRIKLANETLDLAKIYKNLGNKQEKYVALASTEAPAEKVSTLEKDYIKERKRLTAKREEIEQLRKETQQKQNSLADLNTELSQKVAQRAKLKHI